MHLSAWYNISPNPSTDAILTVCGPQGDVFSLIVLLRVGAFVTEYTLLYTTMSMRRIALLLVLTRVSFSNKGTLATSANQYGE